MGVYGLTGPTNAYAELKAMITAETTNLELLYDDGVDDLVVRHIGLNVFLEFNDIDNYGIRLYVGDGWTSGANVLNRYQVISAYAAGAITSGKIVVGTNFIAIGQYNSSSYQSSLLITELSNGDVVCIGGYGSNISYHWGRSYNISKLEVCKMFYFREFSGVELDGKYAKMPIYVGNSNGMYHILGVPATVEGFKLLFKPANTNTPVEGIGTDLFINAYSDYATQGRIDSICLFGEGLHQ